ncbi:MAG: T9SS type A sorting domain-containing protein [Chitinophagaceae bacterium]|nr:T9SS type A sorting domain-containing protein [Chitinophagaceae bacterium]
MLLIQPIRRLVMLLTLLLITITCVKVKAQGPAPQLTIQEDMPTLDITVRQVTYGNGVFLACLIHPTRLYKSLDGMHWSKIASPDLGPDADLTNFRQLSSVAFGAGRFVLTSDSGRIFSSSDLQTWTPSNPGTTHNIITVKYLNNTFYAVGDSATFLSSTDGLTWTTRHTGIGDLTGSYQNIFLGNGHLVIEANNRIGAPTFTQVVYDSTGGVWTADSSRPYNYHGFARGRFYEMSTDSVSVSTDMQHWSAVSLPSNAHSASDVFEDNAHVYLVSANYDTINASPVWHAKITSSDDGIHFSGLYPTSVAGSGGGGYFNQRYFVWAGFASSPMAGSADGTHYHTLGSDTSLLATNGSIYVKLSTTLEEARLYSSSDLTNWIPRDTVTGVQGLTYDGTKFWAVGAQTYTSTDGVSWVNDGPSAHPFTGIAYGNGTYIGWARGLQGAGSDTLWYSTDGINWTLSAIPTVFVDPHAPPQPVDYGYVRKIRFLNGHIIVVANDVIMHSMDGASYTLDFAGNTSSVQHYADIIYNTDSAKYYVFGSNGDGYHVTSLTTYVYADPFNGSFVSPVTDTIHGLPSGVQLQKFQSVDYSAGHFVSVIDDGANATFPNSYLLYSKDGIHWGSRLLDRETQFTSAIARNDTFNIEGTHNYHILANFAGSIPLPVSLFNFNATVKDNIRVLLTWQTADEQNSRQFIIQRNTGTPASVWDSIGILPAAGNSHSLLNYSFTDEHPYPGYNSYRLLMTDADNSYKASEIRRVFIGGDARVKVYPNPAKDHVVIQRTADDGVSTVTLYDAAGRVILSRVFTGYTLTLSLEHLPAGIYHLTMRQSNGKIYQQDILH